MYRSPLTCCRDSASASAHHFCNRHRLPVNTLLVDGRLNLDCFILITFHVPVAVDKFCKNFGFQCFFFSSWCRWLSNDIFFSGWVCVPMQCSPVLCCAVCCVLHSKPRLKCLVFFCSGAILVSALRGAYFYRAGKFWSVCVHTSLPTVGATQTIF